MSTALKNPATFLDRGDPHRPIHDATVVGSLGAFKSLWWSADVDNYRVVVGLNRLIPDAIRAMLMSNMRDSISMPVTNTVTETSPLQWDDFLMVVVPQSVRTRLARLVAGEGERAGFPRLDRSLADQALVLAGGLGITVGRDPSIAPRREGGLEIEIRLDAKRELFIEIDPDGKAEADINGEHIVTGRVETIGSAIIDLL